MQYPGVTLAFEKLRLSAWLPVAAGVHTWGAVATVGAAPAAFYLAVLLAIFYYSFSLPLASSFVANKPATRAIGELAARPAASTFAGAALPGLTFCTVRQPKPSGALLPA